MGDKILLVVESPGKTSKISGYLGSKYIVKACMGIFRDLDPKKMSIDFDNNFEPEYIITKTDVVKNLRTAMKNASILYLATDNDTEGHGMSQALIDVLKPKKYKRVLFNEISKKALLAGIKNGTSIDSNQVDAQKTRRIIDRLFGYMISPIVTKKTGGKSAGRVQSATVRIVIDKETEIKNFMEKNSNSSDFKVTGKISGLKVSLYGFEPDRRFTPPSTPLPVEKKIDLKKIGTDPYKGKLSHIKLIDDDNPTKNVTIFLGKCLKSIFTVHSVTDRPATRSPAPPFTTSTLQQEANRKHSMPIDFTMKVAQKLYEGGYITYMRTDSVEISEDAHADIKKVIEDQFGLEYYKKTVYKNKNSSAQLAHECIRPVHPELLDLESDIDDDAQIKLYKLIWQRTIASQMQPAKLNITTIQIDISKYLDDVKSDPIKIFYYFQSQIEKIIFQGFMKVYVESVDEEIETDTTTNFDGKIPKVGSVLIMEEIIAKQEYLRPPIRYTQASLVKKLEELGIGRPATYVNSIKTIIDRKYVQIGNVAGVKKDILIYKISSKNNKHIMSIDESKSEILLGKDMKKILPTSLGITVTDYLLENFSTLLDYKFTAKLEADMDEVANGNKIWHNIIRKFYDKLKPIVEELGADSKSLYVGSARKLGLDSEGNEIVALKTKDGPAVARTVGKETHYANIPLDKFDLETIKLDDAIKLINKSVNVLGQYEGKNVSVRKSKAGSYYILYGKKQYCPISSEVDHTKLKLKHAIKLITENNEKKNSSTIAEFSIKEGKNTVKATILKGPYSPYIQVLRGSIKKNYRIHPTVDATKLTEKEVAIMISNKMPRTTKKSGSKTAKKTTTTKKAPVKKNTMKK